MNSTRLPGKVMLKILQKPVIHHIFDRLNHCKQLDLTVISTGPYNLNKEIFDYAEKNELPIFSGSETDLISRLYETGLKYNANAIVRITSDCPIIDPKIIDNLIIFYKENHDKYDIVTNCKKHTFPHGLDVEIYSIKTLKKLHTEIKDLEFREWFPLYVQKYPNHFKIFNIENKSDLSHLRLTLDYEDDFKLIKQIYEIINSKIFYLDDVVEILQKNPHLTKINQKYVNHRNIDAPK